MDEQIPEIPEKLIQPEVISEAPPNKNSPIIILLVILVLVIVAGAVYAGMKIQEKKQTTPSAKITPTQNTPTAIPTTDPTADWKIYTNNEFGFELNYPSNWTFTSEGPNAPMIDAKAGKQISGTTSPRYDTISFVDKNNNKQFEIAIFDQYKYPYPTSVDEFKAGYLYTSGGCDIRWGFLPSSVTTVNIGTQSILKAKGVSNAVGSSNSTPINGICYYGKTLNGNLVVLSATPVPSNDDFGLYDQILSTFKFLDSSQTDATAGWKTYKNTKYGFEFKYPNGALLQEESAQPGYGYLFHINIKKDQDDFGVNLYLNGNTKKADLRSYFAEEENNNQSGDPVNPFVQSNPVAKNLLSGEEVFYFSNIYCVAVCKEATWQNKNKDIVFQLMGRQVEDKIFNQILSTFKFTQ